MTEHPTRAELTAAITALLDKADYRKLRLVWMPIWKNPEALNLRAARQLLAAVPSAVK